jgi:hypothetical protein|tara:strand:+ start:3448 stop:3633 length:186 start_codon:yes stop_codon:yes gene_type:complete
VRISPDVYSTGAVFTSHPVETGTLIVASVRPKIQHKKNIRARACATTGGARFGRATARAMK